MYVPAHVYTHALTRRRAHARPLIRTDKLLRMWVTGPCSPPSVRKRSRTLRCSPAASAREHTTSAFARRDHRALFGRIRAPRRGAPENSLTSPNERRQPPCFAYLDVASRRWGPGGSGRKTGGLLRGAAYAHAQWRRERAPAAAGSRSEANDADACVPWLLQPHPHVMLTNPGGGGIWPAR